MWFVLEMTADSNNLWDFLQCMGLIRVAWVFPSNYQLFWLMAHGLAEQHFYHEEAKKWVYLPLALKDVLFFQCRIFLRDQIPKNVPLFSFSFNKKPLSFFLQWDNVSNNGVWDLCSCWSWLKSLILFHRGTISLKYKFIQ